MNEGRGHPPAAEAAHERSAPTCAQRVTRRSRYRASVWFPSPSPRAGVRRFLELGEPLPRAIDHLRGRSRTKLSLARRARSPARAVRSVSASSRSSRLRSCSRSRRRPRAWPRHPRTARRVPGPRTPSSSASRDSTRPGGRDRAAPPPASPARARRAALGVHEHGVHQQRGIDARVGARAVRTARPARSPREGCGHPLGSRRRGPPLHPASARS